MLDFDEYDGEPVGVSLLDYAARIRSRRSPITQVRLQAIARHNDYANIDVALDDPCSEVQDVFVQEFVTRRDLHFHPETNFGAIEMLAFSPVDVAGLLAFPGSVVLECCINELPHLCGPVK